MEWLTASRRVAAFLVPYSLGYVALSLARPLIEQTVGGEFMEALSNIALTIFIGVAIIALTPSVVAGLREIVGESVTGPLRPLRETDSSANSSEDRS